VLKKEEAQEAYVKKKIYVKILWELEKKCMNSALERCQFSTGKQNNTQ
jgi:hypothetical protein